MSMPVKVYDFFAGCGGSSKGFALAGMEPVFALDSDADAKATFEANIPGVHYELSDIENFAVENLSPYAEKATGHFRLFSGCAPCQPFTKQNTIPKEPEMKRSLLGQFQRFVEHYEPELIFVENVPGMQKVHGKDGPFDEFVHALTAHGYHSVYDVVASKDYGVPQMRRRLVLIASLLGPISLPMKTNGPSTSNSQYTTVRQWIGYLPSIRAGEAHVSDPMHRAANLSKLNMRRIQGLKEGQDRRDWPDELKLACHTNGYQGHTDVYGRMWWDKPASGLTTRCISLSNGRFGHPDQDRAISIREAACLQTFPRDFIFKGSLASMARQIGNAVPVLLAQLFGQHFIGHIQTHIKEAA